jgi:translin
MSGVIMDNLDKDVEKISKGLSEKQDNFDSVMGLVRSTVREAAQVITMAHNGETGAASKRLESAYKMVNELGKYGDEFAYQARQAYQEYAEARIFLGIKVDHEIPSCASVGVDQESYLMGLMDVVGELKRELVEALSNNNPKYAKYCHSMMLKIFDSSRSLRFAEAVLQGFRKKQDVARIQIESASSDLLHLGK